MIPLVVRTPALRAPTSQLRALAAAVACALLLTGCGVTRLVHRGPVASSPPPSAAAKAKSGARASRADKSSKSAKGTSRAAAGAASALAAQAKPQPPADPLEAARWQAAQAPTDPYGPFRVAQLELARDSSIAAERGLHAALARDPSYPPALALLSKLEFQSARHAEAIAMIEAARSHGAALPDAVLEGLALHYDALGQTDKARDVMASLTGGGRDRTTSPIVFVLLRGATPDSAAELAREAAHRNPKSAVCQNNFGITRLRAGDPKEAREAFTKAIALDPSLPGPYYNLSILEKYYALDDSAAARWFALYRERSNVDPDGLARAFAPAPPAQGIASKRD